MKKLKTIAKMILIATLVVTSSAIYAAYFFGIKYNGTDSAPHGFYVRASDGNMVYACPPEPWATESVRRGYRMNAGTCPGPSEPLLKPVAGWAGDRVRNSIEGTEINGTAISGSAPLMRDSQGRWMGIYRYGETTLGKGEYWLLSTHDPQSFDSRYFGVLKQENILARVRPLLTW